ncbi:MAG: Dihydropteroate synthase [Thermodesulfobacteriota bacterium]|nr:Dihydropteroate synthase [Thermodesulfobacteriota bacterium]
MDAILKWNGHVLDLGKRTHVMGVLNVTPDSFSDGGHYFETDRAIEHGIEMDRDGADIIDIGGESTRPYSEPVSAAEEMDRVIPVIEALRKEISAPISIDTCKAQVARQALTAGASMINDISALRFDPEMAGMAAQADVPVILMHMKGTPGDMQKNPVYGDLLLEITDFLREAVDRCEAAGVRRDLTVVDPGIGFGKTFDHNLQIIRELHRFQCLDRPILFGPSNKAFIGHILNKEPHERDTGTMAAIAAGVMNGAHMVRAHDVRKAVETVRIIDAIKRGKVED